MSATERENVCSSCHSPLHSFERQRQLCTICEGYAEPARVRDEAEFEREVMELMGNDPFFRSQPTREV